MYVVVPLKPLHIFAKRSFIFVWSGPKYISETHKRSNGFICVTLTCWLWPISQCIDLDPISRSTPLFWNSSFLKIHDTHTLHQSMLWTRLTLSAKLKLISKPNAKQSANPECKSAKQSANPAKITYSNSGIEALEKGVTLNIF